MQLVRTEKARQELTPGVRTLSQKERSVLLLADGRKSLLDLRGLFDGEAEQIALALIQRGYLQVGAPAPAGRGTLPARPGQPAPADITQPLRLPAQADGSQASISQPPAVAADSFEGKRSLATTRMFLFDLCERMFARRDPALAERYRGELRGAKDRAAMLAVSRDMLEEIERVAGHERADSISERIAMLLPPEEATSA